MLTKNAKLNWQNKTPLICHVLAPIIILMTILSVDAIARHINDVYDENPPTHALGLIPNCKEFRHPGPNCTTIGFGVLGEIEGGYFSVHDIFT